MELWDYERQAWNSGAETVCGVDEAGAGPLMGPVYEAAVILPPDVRARIDAAAETVAKIAESGMPAYGINTGFGRLAQTHRL